MEQIKNKFEMFKTAVKLFILICLAVFCVMKSKAQTFSTDEYFLYKYNTSAQVNYNLDFSQDSILNIPDFFTVMNIYGSNYFAFSDLFFFINWYGGCACGDCGCQYPEPFNDECISFIWYSSGAEFSTCDGRTGIIEYTNSDEYFTPAEIVDSQGYLLHSFRLIVTSENPAQFYYFINFNN